MTIVPPSPAQLHAYLDRIGFRGEPAPDLDTLRAIHRGHAENVPWEILDVALGRGQTRDPVAAFEKIVAGGRGGWCYEMNGLMAWMLEAIGFRVTRLAGAVYREGMGDSAIGNHLVLLIELDRTWVADVGFGTGLIEPVPLAEGEIAQRPALFRLERLDDGWWRFHNHAGLMPPSFDFSPDVTDEALMDERCHWLQTSPDSPFHGRVVVNAYRAGRLEMLALPTHKTLSEDGLSTMELDRPDAFVALLEETFGIVLPEAAMLWDRVGTAAPQPQPIRPESPPAAGAPPAP